MQTTPTADSVQYQAPHPFYVPLEREGVESLAGEWRFRPDPKDVGGEREWFRSGVRDRVCPVPSAWQFLFDDLRDYRGPVWYERDFAVAPAWAGKRLAVVFCGVDHYAAVWVNGQLAAAHEGGYLPFAVDVSALLAADAELAELGLAVGEAGYALGAMPGCNFWGYVHPRSGLFSDIPSDNPMGWTYLHALAASGDDHAHYQFTPVTFAPKIGYKLSSTRYLDLAQGLLECLHEIHGADNRDAP